jgi:hypothetical protein
MALNLHAIVSDLLTWASAAKVAGGAVLHKLWQWAKAAWADAKAEAAKLEADAKADAKKL